MIRNFQLGTSVAIAYGEGGFLGVQTDGFGENSGVHGRDVIGQFGLIGRPLDASEGKGALTLFADEGAEGFAWIGFDVRDAEKCPPLSGGSAALYNSRGAYQLLDYETETSTLYVPINEGAKAHMIQVGNDSNGKAVVDIRHADGMAVIMLENSLTIKNAAGDAYIELNDSGIVLNGNTKAVGGIDIGGGAAMPLALGPPLVTYLEALHVMLLAVSKLIDIKMPPPPPPAPPASGIIDPFVGASSALLAAINATLAKGL
jgi:hypothetical protein